MTDEAYLYTLISYIENNPLKAKMVKVLGEYEHSSYLSFVEQREPIECLKNSFMFEKFTTKEARVEFFESSVDERVLDEIQKASKLVVTSVKKKTLDAMNLKQSFLEIENQADRDEKIFQAYEDGYSQHVIAQCLHLSQAQINRIIKKARGISIT